MTSDFSRLKDSVKACVQLEELAHLRIHGGLKRAGRYYKGLCPFHNDTNPSLTIDTRKNTYRCYSCGASGDAIQFLMELDGISFKEAVLQLAGLYGLADTGTKPKFQRAKKPVAETKEDEARREARDIEKAVKLVRGSMPAAGTLVETYLKSRAIEPARLPEGILQQLRFIPSYGYWHKWDKARRFEEIGKFPAMISPMQNAKGEIRGVHITYLKADGTGKADIADKDKEGGKLPAKKMKGRPWGCAIRLGPPAPTMVFSEGIENGLSSTMINPDWPVWVAGSLTNLSGAGQNRKGKPHPNKEGRTLPCAYPDYGRPGLTPPPICKTAYLLAERDSRDQVSVDALIERTLRRWKGMDIPHVFKVNAPDGLDHNDILRGAMNS